MRRTKNPTKDVGSLAPALKVLLNDAAGLALDAKQAHWNVKGPSFQGLHELFDKIHAAAVEYSDLIGERLAQFGVKAIARPADSQMRGIGRASGAEYAVSMASELAVFSGRLSEAAAAADEAGDAATLDILSEILRGVDKWRWFVESHLEVEGTRFNPCERLPWKGRSSGKPLSAYDSSALDRGMRVELEHTPDRCTAMRIAADHLAEDARYYDKLALVHVERRANPRKRRNTDRELRDLERAARAGERGAEERLAVARRRAGIQAPLDSTEGLVAAIRRWWKSKEPDWGDLSYGVRFWTPEEWSAKGEAFGQDAPVNMTSEGGFNQILCYTEGPEQTRLVDEWNEFIDSLGWRWETNACWAFSFYPKTRRNGDVCSRCGDDKPDGEACPRCGVTIEDMMRRSYRDVRRRRNAVCPSCGRTDADMSPFSGKLDCSCAKTQTRRTLKGAFDAAVVANNIGDDAAFERHATEWAHLLYGSRTAGEAAIAEAAAHEGSRLDGLRVMVFG